MADLHLEWERWGTLQDQWEELLPQWEAQQALWVDHLEALGGP